MRGLNASRFREGASSRFFNRRDRRKHLLADLLIGFTVFGTEIFFFESDRPANHDCDRVSRDFSSFRPRLKGTKNPHRDNWGERLGNYHADPGSSLLDLAGQGPGSFGKITVRCPCLSKLMTARTAVRSAFERSTGSALTPQRIDPNNLFSKSVFRAR